MERTLYFTAVCLVKFLQALPLTWAAWIGRRGGALAYWLDFRHRRVALRNLTLCFCEKSRSEIRALARENFRRLGENYCSAAKTASMSWAELQKHVQFVNCEALANLPHAERRQSRVVAIGHFGNFELYARFGAVVAGYQGATTYRALKQPSLNRLLQSLRERSDCLFFERRSEAKALRAAFSKGSLLLGLLADQHAGPGGVPLAFLGRPCSASAAPAILALRYQCALYTAICYRVGLGRWDIELGDQIPTQEAGRARSVAAITADINSAFEAAVRRDPANWFWVHNRWKPMRRRIANVQSGSPALA